MICMLHTISSNILNFLSSVKSTFFSDLNEFEEMQPIEEEEDDIWENLDAQLADTVNIIKNFNFWVLYGRSKMLSKWKINLYVKKCKNDSSSNLININFKEFFFFLLFNFSRKIIFQAADWNDVLAFSKLLLWNRVRSWSRICTQRNFHLYQGSLNWKRSSIENGRSLWMSPTFLSQ